MYPPVIQDKDAHKHTSQSPTQVTHETGSERQQTGRYRK
jgi:hypothetical protein